MAVNKAIQAIMNRLSEMKKMMGVLMQFLPNKSRIVMSVVVLGSLSTYLLFRGIQQIDIYNAFFNAGKRSAALQALPLVVVFMTTSSATFYLLLSRYIWGQLTDAIAGLRIHLLKLHLLSRPQDVEPSKTEGGLSSRTSDQEKSWLDGFRIMILGAWSAGATGLVVFLISVSAGLWMFGSALIFSFLQEVLLGGKIILTRKAINDKGRSPWDRRARFLATAHGQRAAADRDYEYDLKDAGQYNEYRRRQTHRMGWYTSLNSLFTDLGIYVIILGTPAFYLWQSHQPLNSPNAILLSAVTALFQRYMNQVAQGLNSFREGESSLGHILMLLSLGSKVSDLEKKLEELDGEAQEREKRGDGKIKPVLLLLRKVLIFDWEDPHGKRANILRIPQLEFTARADGSGSIMSITGTSGITLGLRAIIGYLHPNRLPHLKGALGREGLVDLDGGGGDSGLHLVTTLVDMRGSAISVADAKQSDKVQGYLQSANNKSTIDDRIRALLQVGVLGEVKLEDSIKTIDRRVMVFLQFARLLLMQPERRKLIAIDDVFRHLSTPDVEKLVPILHKLREQGSHIVVGEKTPASVPSQLDVDERRTIAYNQGEGLLELAP